MPPDAGLEDHIECFFSNYAQHCSIRELALPMLNAELLFSLGDHFALGNRIFYQAAKPQLPLELYPAHPTAQLVESLGQHWTLGIIFKPGALARIESCDGQDLRHVSVVQKIQAVKRLFSGANQLDINSVPVLTLQSLRRFFSAKVTFREMPVRLKTVLDELNQSRGLGKSIGSIAQLAGLSHKSMISLVKKSLDVTPLRFVHHHAILQAIIALKNGDVPIAQIALDAGFYDQAHFNRVFKSFMTVTAGQYRRANSGVNFVLSTEKS